MMTKVFLEYANGERKDITDIYSSHRETLNGVRINYHSWIINGEVVPERHQLHHMFAKVKMLTSC